MAAPSPSSDGSPPSWERRQQQREQRGAKNANGGAELENLPSHFLRARSLSSNSFRSFFDFERAQILWFLKNNNAIGYPCFFLHTAIKSPFGLKKWSEIFFSSKSDLCTMIIIELTNLISPTFDKKIFSLILLLLITKNQENHVNYDYDSNRFSVQTWRKKRDRKRRKIKSKIWEIDDETMFFWAKWYLCVESALSMTDMARQRAIWMGQDSNYGFSRQRKSQWCVTSCTWNWIVD